MGVVASGLLTRHMHVYKQINVEVLKELYVVLNRIHSIVAEDNADYSATLEES